jgi:hypothetical protein
MGSQVGVIGGGNLGEQLRIAKKDGAAVAVLPPAVQSAATVTSEIIDTLGFNVALANINVGAIGSAGKYTTKVQVSDDKVDGNFVDLAALDATPAFGRTATGASEVGTANTDVQLLTDLRSGKRYMRYVSTLISGTSVLFGITVVLGAAEVLPADAN